MPNARLQRTRALYDGHYWATEEELRNMRPRLATAGFTIGETIQVRLPARFRPIDTGFTANVIEGEYDTATDPGDEAA